MKQEYTSAKTSINTVTKIYKNIEFVMGSEVLDYGGGKYDTNTEYLKERGVNCYVFDPYNRTEEHNQKVLDYFRYRQGSDYIVCANVLNVIKEDFIIIEILHNIKQLISEKGIIYIQIYEGGKQSIGKRTIKGYQRNQKTVDYETFLRVVFNENWNISRKSNIFVLSKKGEVSNG